MARKPDQTIINALNEILTAELTAINQYFLHAKMFQTWNYMRLASTIRAESIDEMKHADQLIDRILYLEGLPNVQRMGHVSVGENPLEMMKADLELEYKAIPDLQAGIKVCRDLGDEGSRVLLESILVSEEHHVDWIEAQLDQIEHVGLANYLALQIRPA